MILDMPNSLYAGQQAMLGIGLAGWSWSAMASAAVVVAGPYCVVASQVYVPGAAIAGTFVPGTAQDKIFVPGSEASKIYTPGSDAGGVC